MRYLFARAKTDLCLCAIFLQEQKQTCVYALSFCKSENRLVFMLHGDAVMRIRVRKLGYRIM
jgi:hypothetical protein